MTETTTARPPRQWNTATAFGLVFAVTSGAILLATSAPRVAAHVTSLPAALYLLGPWLTGAVLLGLVSWWLIRLTGTSFRNDCGVFPRWLATASRTVHSDYTINSWLLGAATCGVFGVVHGIGLALNPTPTGPLAAELITQTLTAAMISVVLLAVNTAILLDRSLPSRSWDVVGISVAVHAVLAGPNIWAIGTGAVGGAVVTVLYLRHRRLGPIIVGHALAVAPVALLGVWISSL